MNNYEGLLERYKKSKKDKQWDKRILRDMMMYINPNTAPNRIKQYLALPTYKKMKILYYAILNGYEVAAKWLIQNGASLNVTFKKNPRLGLSLLDLAITEGNVERVKLLLKWGANPLFMNDKGVLPIQTVLATDKGDVLCDLNDDTWLIYGLSRPLFNQRIAIAKDLLDAGADPRVLHSIPQWMKVYCVALGRCRRAANALVTCLKKRSITKYGVILRPFLPFIWNLVYNTRRNYRWKINI